jgi:hypothetical protein
MVGRGAKLKKENKDLDCLFRHWAWIQKNFNELENKSDEFARSDLIGYHTL